MKSLKLIMTILVFGLFTMSMFSCGGNKKSASADSEQAEAKQGKEYTSAYICPMHCKDSGSDKPGKCPACGMDYKKNDKDGENHEGHDHDGEDHEGHDHDGESHEGHDH